MRVVVTGTQGQVACALAELGSAAGASVQCVGRPVLDLTLPDRIAPVLASAEPDVVVNAAAYTAVDQAEHEPELAHLVNAAGAGAVAAAAAKLGVPVIHLSTDYVFDGNKATPYVESDPVSPATVYGASKLAGERAVAAATADHVILRTAWVYSPVGKNFVRTMLMLAAKRDEVRVVADQSGCPTYAPDLAGAVLTIAKNVLDRSDPELRGVFHLAGSEGTTWAQFADAIFTFLAENGGKRPVLTPIPSTEYPVAARRPANSRLDCRKLARLHGVELPSWRASLEACLQRLTNNVP